MTRISDTQRRKVFGLPCSPRVHVVVETPWGIRVRCHRLVADRFLYACRLAVSASEWRPKRIDSYACRAVRGTNTTSLHAYALAWDFFDRPLPEAVDVWGATNAPDPPFRDAFTKAGFVAGATFTSRKDYPHIEWAAGVPTKVPDGVQAPPGQVTLAPPIQTPLVKPITEHRYGEAAGVRVSTHFVTIPALDKEGRGWYRIEYPYERVFDLCGQGSSPADDGVYWPTVVCTVQPRGAGTVVCIDGEPNQATGFWYKLLEEE